MRAELGGAEATRRKAEGRGRGRSLWLLPEGFFLKNSQSPPPGRLAGLSPAPSGSAGHRELGFPASPWCLQASGFQPPGRTGLSRLLRKGKARAARARRAARLGAGRTGSSRRRSAALRQLRRAGPAEPAVAWGPGSGHQPPRLPSLAPLLGSPGLQGQAGRGKLSLRPPKGSLDIKKKKFTLK